ncbi:LamG domain-containing protein [Ktedonobacter robiniae]|uniref:LamG-like jellyroll fold domain-containing protein n=1 Tax=Ktedonobacter robiniae TaxID=2778365 RepID=A0ABQ3URV5_9CHLR|nr:LamG domain-containing protein [Ktedonobacter robiniae]GHO55529.1 hypothetical protein KSB_40040 [Ktedonobacter robiniae]
MPIVTTPFSPRGVTQGGIKVVLAGQDITPYIDESSIDIKDTLGQGAGSGSGASPRASTFTLKSSLGPAATAVGSGTRPTQPMLVRNGEIVIYDANNNRIFGGYLTKITDQTETTQVYTQLEGVDYYQTFARTIVNDIYSGSDVQILTQLLQKYAPQINIKTIPTLGSMTFSLKNYRNKTLLDCLTDIIDSTGYQAWVDPYKNFHYVSPGSASTAPFKLSNNPDFVTSFQVGVDSYEIDDNAIINRVYFYGGRKPSNDFVQDLSPQVNGNNTTFLLAYYPRTASDGKVHAYVNGVEKTIGYQAGTTLKDKLRSQGGTADVLLNADAHTLTFDIAPPAGSTVTCKYRYELPLMVVLPDPVSVRYFGGYFDGTVSDQTVVDTQVAIQRAKVLLLEQAYGLRTLKLRCWRSGLQSGMVLRVDHSIRGIHDSFIVQEVDIKPMGNGFFEYDVTCGAWNWSMVDILNHLFAAAQPNDTSSQESTTQIDDQEQNENLSLSFSVSTTTTKFGTYLAHTFALGDGRDAYAGFCSIGGPNYVNSVLADAPIRYYSMDESSGTVVNDLGSQQQNGALTGGVLLGHPGPILNWPTNADAFDGSTGYINLPMTGLPRGTDATYEIWVNTSSFANQGTAAISPRYMSINVDGTNAIHIAAVATGGFTFQVNYSGGIANLATTASLNRWYHIVGVWQAATHTIALYLNGAPAPYISVGNYGFGTAGANIGRRVDGSGYAAGNMAHAAIYNYALSPARILAHTNMGLLGHE